MTARAESILIVVLLTVSAFAAPLAMIVMSPPPDGDGIVLVIGADVGKIIQAAGGYEVGPYSAPWGALAAADSADFVTRLATAGAWRITDGTWLAALCGEGA